MILATGKFESEATGRTVMRQVRQSYRNAMAPRLRSLLDFALEEITIPDGQYQGRKFNVERQPVGALFLAAAGSGQWPRVNATGTSQSGKTFHCSLIPLIWHLFEYRETVVFGLPDMDMARDKWREDILPAIESTRFRDELPSRGAGSLGGTPGAIRLKNGATLRFMSGGGGDKSRAGFTTRVLIITETDGFDDISASSREGDKISQLEARQASYDPKLRRTYFECTLTNKEGRTWRELERGTFSRIAMPCPICNGFSVATNSEKDRAALIGWQDCDDLIQVAERARWTCMACHEPWSEAQRAASMQKARLVHQGQEIEPDGRIIGTAKPTDTLGFRWGGVHNLFAPAAAIAALEWTAKREAEGETDPEARERTLCQFYHGLPHVRDHDRHALDSERVKRRQVSAPRGLIPADAEYVTLGVDCGKFSLHYTLVAWCSEPVRRSQIVDYGVRDVNSDDEPTERALLTALRELADVAAAGWPMHGVSEPRVPDLCLVDSGWFSEVVYTFCNEAEGFVACKGYGATKQGGLGRAIGAMYLPPKRKTRSIREVGNHYHVVHMKNLGITLVHVDVDYYKCLVQDALRVPMGKAEGVMTLFSAPAAEHERIARHCTAEKQVTDFRPGRGPFVRMERVGSRQNHFLDCLAYASCAGWACGSRLFEAAEPDEPTPTPTETPAVKSMYSIRGGGNFVTR